MRKTFIVQRFPHHLVVARGGLEHPHDFLDTEKS